MLGLKQKLQKMTAVNSKPKQSGKRILQLDVEEVVHDYQKAWRKLLVFGYNATLTTGVEAQRQPKRHFEQLMVCVRPPTIFCRRIMSRQP